MDVTTYARTQLESAINLASMCLGDITTEQYNWKPQGNVNSIAKTHVHVISGLDFFINSVLAGGAPRYSGIATKHGLPANPLEIWGFQGTIPVEAMKELQAEAQKAALEYVGTLKEADLDAEVDTQFLGKQTRAWVVQLATTHTAGHAGDMAAVKGMQGMKGLPF